MFLFLFLSGEWIAGEAAGGLGVQIHLMAAGTMAAGMMAECWIQGVVISAGEESRGVAATSAAPRLGPFEAFAGEWSGEWPDACSWLSLRLPLARSSGGERDGVRDGESLSPAHVARYIGAGAVAGAVAGADTLVGVGAVGAVGGESGGSGESCEGGGRGGGGSGGGVLCRNDDPREGATVGEMSSEALSDRPPVPGSAPENLGCDRAS